MKHLEKLKTHCEIRLAQNADKEHWGNMTQNLLISKTRQALQKVTDKVCPKKHQEALDEIADLVNYAGFIYDNTLNKLNRGKE